MAVNASTPSAPPFIRIDGTGPVGLACALWLTRAGVPPTQIGLPLARQAVSILPDAGPRRAIALAEGSRQLLERLIPLPPSGRIGTVEIFQRGTTGNTRIESRDLGLGSLGHVVDWQALVGALHAAAERLPFGDPTQPVFGKPALVVNAGGMPPPAQRTKDEFSIRDTGQSGLLFEVQVDNTGDTAFECFCPEGPLALLPAPPAESGARYTVVWCGPTALNQERTRWPAEMIGHALREALQAVMGVRQWHRFARRFGRLQVCTPAVSVPLPRVSRRKPVAPGRVWIGNAAQALHPVAGQGLNLGLRDAFELARQLGDAWVGHRQPALDTAVQRYARARQVDRQLTIQSTDLFAAGFGWPLASRLQSVLLTAIHLCTPLRRSLGKALVYGHR
ncbi:MAG: FAD-dependent monooxygenase [Lautropia sp.]|nr:FAD-dependent monooxygenase [Lautropia sp.]